MLDFASCVKTRGPLFDSAHSERLITGILIPEIRAR